VRRLDLPNAAALGAALRALHADRLDADFRGTRSSTVSNRRRRRRPSSRIPRAARSIASSWSVVMPSSSGRSAPRPGVSALTETARAHANLGRTKWSGDDVPVEARAVARALLVSSAAEAV